MSEKLTRKERFKNWKLKVIAENESFSVRESIKNWREWYQYVILEFVVMSIVLLILLTFPVTLIPMIVGLIVVLVVEVYLFEVKGMWKIEHVNGVVDEDGRRR